MSKSTQDYTVYIDSASRRTPQIDTNEIQLPIHVPEKIAPISHIQLGSLEMKPSQRTIETEWSMMYYDQGLSFDTGSNAVLDWCGRCFYVVPTLNRVQSIVTIDNDLLEVCFDSPHGLTPENLTWASKNLSMRFLLMNRTGKKKNQLSSLWQVVNEKTLLVPTTCFAPTLGDIWMYCEPFRDPHQLSEFLTKTLAPCDLCLSYSPVLGHYSLRTTTRPAVKCRGSPVLDRLGFTSPLCFVPEEPEAKLGECFDPERCLFNDHTTTAFLPRYVCHAMAGQRQLSTVQLYPCVYDCHSFVEQLDLQWNRFSAELPCDPCQPVSCDRSLVVSDQCGQCFAVELPYGSWTAQWVEEWVTTALRPTGIQLLWVIEKCASGWQYGYFKFIHAKQQSFSLEFNLKSSGLSVLLGYDQRVYRGQESYCSRQLWVPQNGVCPSVYFNWSLSPCRPGGQLQLVQVPQRPVMVRVENLEQRLLTVVHPQTQTHGLETGQLCLLSISSGGGSGGGSTTVCGEETTTTTTVEVLVERRLSAHQFIVHSLPVAVHGSLHVTVAPLPPVGLNLYWTGVTPHRVKPRIMGLTQPVTDQLSSVSGNTIVFPLSPDLGHPDYILLTVRTSKEEGFSHDRTSQHVWQGDLQGEIFAKIIVHPHLAVHRAYPMVLQYGTSKSLHSLFFTFLNPDHSLYHMHGQEWSATLNMCVV
jgi:hypothetical protein